MNKVLVVIVSLIFLVVALGSSQVLLIGQAAMLYSIVIIVIDFFRDRVFRLIHVWHFAFLYIVASEMVVSADLLDKHPYGKLACLYLIVGNLLIYFGYLIFSKSSLSLRFLVAQRGVIGQDAIFQPRKSAFSFLILFFVVFVAYALPIAISTLSQGRVTDGAVRSVDNLLLDNFMLSVGLVLPAMVKQIFGGVKVGYLRAWVLSFMVIVLCLIFLMLGTRYYVLFCLGGYLIASNRSAIFRLKVKSFLLILLLIVGVGGALNAVKDLRVGGLSGDYSAKSTVENVDLFSSVASVLSPEGVVKLNADAIDYFERHEHLYGMSSGFLFYFWIPRAVWPDKPKMIGYWLIREYEEGFSDGHSASVGYFGDLYADFYLLVFPCLFFLGKALARVEFLALKSLGFGGRGLVLGAMAYPAVFFFLRSPITTLTNLIGMYLAFRLVCLAVYRK